jgi:hypothetical protein
MALYKDYFGIKAGYSPIMTREGINKSPETWLNFYPHKSFVEILRELFKSLGGGKKSLWITGAYGTGKSHASLVLQKLFCDDEGRVQKWLGDRKALIPGPVAKELLEWRAKRVMVVYDVNADGVDPKNQFLMRMQRAIAKALEAGGHRIPLKGKLDEVIERVGQEERQFFEKRDEMQERLSHLNAGIKTAGELEKRLRGPKPDAGLISDVMQVMGARDIYPTLGAEEFLAWVEEALRANGHSKLIYIWDEFSSFVDRNRNELKTMEQLAEAFEQGWFYFVPVTHTEITSYLAAASESAKKANDRFAFKRLDLPNETALKLAADAFGENQEKADEWRRERDELWHSVRGVVESHMATKNAQIEAADFKNILPIHPMAAFLLKHLSVAVGSNSRSIFEYLNGTEFRDFMDKGGPDVRGRQLLTVDHLWGYFIERDDLGADAVVLETRADYSRREEDLQPDERRVFKAMLLFALIEAKQGEGHPLLCAGVENIQRSFEGDGAIQGVDAVLGDLEQKHCFTIANGRCERFRDRSNAEDVEKRAAQLDAKFDDLVLSDAQGELVRQLRSCNHGGRFDVRATGVNGLTPSSVAKRDLFGEKGNRVLLHFILARDENEQLLIPDKARDMSRHFRDHRMLFVALPEASFCRDNAKAWEELKENEARRMLAKSSGDRNAERLFESRVSGAKEAWLSKVMGSAKLIIYLTNENGEPFSEEVTWGKLKQDWLNSYAKRTFEAYTDSLCGFNVVAFGQATHLKSWALAGMDFDGAKQGAMKNVVATWQKAGVAGSEGWFDENPNHPLTLLRDFCKKRQDNTVGAGHECSMRKLYIDLQRPPFGLLCVPHSAFVLGFVLKTWLTGQRQMQWTDGTISRPLDKDSLAEIIEAAVKDDGANNIRNEKRICRLSKEEKAFIEKSGVIFGHPPLLDGTVEAALSAIASRLETRSQRVPLWVLPDYIEARDEPSADAMRKVIEALCAANSISSKGNTDERGNRVKEIGETLLATPGLAEAMVKYIDPMVFDEAFRHYVDAARPDLKEAAERLGDSAYAYRNAIKRLLSSASGWLWKRGDIEAAMEEVHRQILCAQHVNWLAGTTGHMEMEDALNRLHGAAFIENRVPAVYWEKKHPALSRFFALLQRKPLQGEDAIAIEGILDQQRDTIRDVFFDVGQARQMEAMREIFGELWPVSGADARELYGDFPQDSASLDEQSFKARGRAKIEEHGQKLVSAQVAALWNERTGSTSPAEWGRVNGLPAECLLTLDDPKGIIDTIASPRDASADRLAAVLGQLSKEGAFLDVATARGVFLKRALRGRFSRSGLGAEQMSDWLRRELGDSPNGWLIDQRLDGAVERFIQNAYHAQMKGKALEKASALSDAETRALLLRLIDQMPDVGISVLECPQ